LVKPAGRSVVACPASAEMLLSQDLARKITSEQVTRGQGTYGRECVSYQVAAGVTLTVFAQP